jgi:hypothetical protein
MSLKKHPNGVKASKTIFYQSPFLFRVGEYDIEVCIDGENSIITLKT